MTSIIKLKQNTKKIQAVKAVKESSKMTMVKNIITKNDKQMVGNNTVFKIFKDKKDKK